MDRDAIKAGRQLFRLCTHDATCSEVVVVGYTDHMQKLIVREVGSDRFSEALPAVLHPDIGSVRRSIRDSIERHKAAIYRLVTLDETLPHPPGDEDDEDTEYGGEGGDAVAPTPVVECVGVIAG